MLCSRSSVHHPLSVLRPKFSLLKVSLYLWGFIDCSLKTGLYMNIKMYISTRNDLAIFLKSGSS